MLYRVNYIYRLSLDFGEKNIIKINITFISRGVNAEIEPGKKINYKISD